MRASLQHKRSKRMMSKQIQTVTTMLVLNRMKMTAAMKRKRRKLSSTTTEKPKTKRTMMTMTMTVMAAGRKRMKRKTIASQELPRNRAVTHRYFSSNKLIERLHPAVSKVAVHPLPSVTHKKLIEELASGEHRQGSCRVSVMRFKSRFNQLC